MPEIIYNAAKNEWEYRQMLRSPYIDYFNGRFFITIQVCHNKSVFGAIVGEDCVLNELGEAVKAAWLEEPSHVDGLTIDEFVVMPNHFHAILEYHCPGRGGPGPTCGGCGGRATACGGRATACGGRATAPGRLKSIEKPTAAAIKYTRDPHARDLPYVVGVFKSFTTRLYHKLKETGRCVDIGPKLWQESFYDELIRDDEQYRNTVRYIQRNPANWNSDRFGAVTSFAEGNLSLLQSEYIAYLSSEGFCEGEELPMRRVAVGPLRPTGGESNGSVDSTAESSLVGRSGPTSTRSGPTATHSSPNATKPPVISTFTSFYERRVLAKCLASGRRFIWVCPGGISPEALAKTAAAREAGNALLISPVAAGTSVNKQRANWCNQFIAKNAAEIWVGHVRPGGSLESILKAVGRNLA